MPKKAIRIEGNSRIAVEATEAEVLYRDQHPDVEYICGEMVRGKECQAKMKLAKGWIELRNGEESPHAPYFSRFNEQIKHLQDCPNNQVRRALRRLSMDTSKLNLEETFFHLENHSVSKPNPDDMKKEQELGERNDDKEVDEEEYEKDYEPRGPRSVMEIYGILKNCQPGQCIWDEQPYEEHFVNKDTYQLYRTQKLVLNQFAVVIGEKSKSILINRTLYNYNGAFSFCLQDPYKSDGVKRIFYLMEFDQNVNGRQITDRIKSKESLWLVLGNWTRKDEMDGYIIYHCHIEKDSQIVELNREDYVDYELFG